MIEKTGISRNPLLGEPYLPAVSDDGEHVVCSGIDSPSAYNGGVFTASLF
jgi:hypothetical protein